MLGDTGDTVLGRLPDLIDKRQLADHFHVSLRTINNWAAIGKLPKPAVIIGNRPRWRRDEIASVLTSNDAEKQKAMLGGGDDSDA